MNLMLIWTELQRDDMLLATILSLIYCFKPQNCDQNCDQALLPAVLTPSQPQHLSTSGVGNCRPRGPAS